MSKGEHRALPPLPAPPARELHPLFVNLLLVNPCYILAYLHHLTRSNASPVAQELQDT
ncbi:hypothetical protein PENSPDRAFT_649770 [Peniophora sp. CONT]|nr:hypothetical protein PENSPDRAFT_649770 [Peniophora sp. CONT]